MTPRQKSGILRHIHSTDGDEAMTKGLILSGLCALIAVGIASRHPWQEMQKERAEFARVQRETEALQDEKLRLAREVTRLETPFGMEEEARRRGYHPSFERPIEAGEK
jgi:hypothetical protein